MNKIKDTLSKLKAQYPSVYVFQIINYLGIKIGKTHNGFTLNQKTKTEEITKNINVEDSKPYVTPMETRFQRLGSEDIPIPNNTKY